MWFLASLKTACATGTATYVIMDCIFSPVGLCYAACATCYYNTQFTSDQYDGSKMDGKKVSTSNGKLWRCLLISHVISSRVYGSVQWVVCCGGVCSWCPDRVPEWMWHAFTLTTPCNITFRPSAAFQWACSICPSAVVLRCIYIYEVYMHICVIEVYIIIEMVIEVYLHICGKTASGKEACWTHTVHKGIQIGLGVRIYGHIMTHL